MQVFQVYLGHTPQAALRKVGEASLDRIYHRVEPDGRRLYVWYEAKGSLNTRLWPGWAHQKRER